jgi:soluble lytic murein transglycosylase-like protein
VNRTMTCYRSMVVSLILSAVLLLVSIFGPLPIVNNGVQILEFGTSTSFADTTKNNPTIIENKGQDTRVLSNTPLKAATSINTSANIAKVATQVATPVKNSLEARAKEIVAGTPLDYQTALILIKYADQYNLNPSLILSVIEVESNFNQWEVGSSKDRGFMQIIPATEKWLAQDFGKDLGLKYNPKQIFDPEYNIGLAAAYLNVLKKNYGGDYNRMLSEYNRGPSNLKRYYQKHGTYSTTYSRKVLKAENQYLVFNK